MIVREIECPESSRSSGGKYLFTLSADSKGHSCLFWVRNHDARIELQRLLATAAAEVQDSIYVRQSRAAAQLANELRGDNHG